MLMDLLVFNYNGHLPWARNVDPTKFNTLATVSATVTSYQ